MLLFDALFPIPYKVATQTTANYICQCFSLLINGLQHHCTRVIVKKTTQNWFAVEWHFCTESVNKKPSNLTPSIFSLYNLSASEKLSAKKPRLGMGVKIVSHVLEKQVKLYEAHTE